VRSGCFWHRLSGFGGTLSEILGSDLIAFDAPQTIVDILPTDFGFDTDSDCGTWFNTPRTGPQTNIPPGEWLVGIQVTPGTYMANVSSGCYWERERDFTERNDIIANDFVDTPGQRFVTIAASDVGFYADDECGTWTRTNAIVAPSQRQTQSDIERNRMRYDQRIGKRR
jgi:hypothetical protein